MDFMENCFLYILYDLMRLKLSVLAVLDGQMTERAMHVAAQGRADEHAVLVSVNPAGVDVTRFWIFEVATRLDNFDSRLRPICMNELGNSAVRCDECFHGATMRSDASV